MPDPLDAIRERLAKATPGPWHLAKRQLEYRFRVYDSGGCPVADGASRTSEQLTKMVENAALIAHAPTDLTWACAEIDRLRASLAAAEKVVEVAEETVMKYRKDAAWDARTGGTLSFQYPVHFKRLSDTLTAYHATRKGTG